MNFAVALFRDALSDVVNEVYLEEVLSGIVQGIKDHFRPLSCGVVVKQGEGLRVKISRGLSYTYIKELHAKGQHPLYDAVRKEGAPMVIDENHPLYPTGMEHSYATLVVVPLYDKAEVMGFFFMDFEEKKRFTQEDVAFLEAVGYLVSVSLDYYALRDRVEELNNYDTLTGVYNYKRFHELLYQEVVRSEDTGHVFSIVLFAITGLKELNNLYGHIKGDELLKWVAQLLKKKARRFDHVARYAAAKFAVILPEESKEFAEKFAKEVLEEFSSSQWTGLKVDIFLDVGIVTFPTDADDEKTLLSRLEQCVYEAKRQKGNTLVLWPVK